jgi:hypothetical protein
VHIGHFSVSRHSGLHSVAVESQIRSCLGYEVLRNPDPWIGAPSASFLESFLIGASFRADYVKSDLPPWRISGVLDDPEFYAPFVHATGRPTLTIRWATAVEMTHLSLADGFALLRDRALEWHRSYGVNEDREEPRGQTFGRSPEAFWSELVARPGMFIGDNSGWKLYCFLQGMSRGGDWLDLPDMPRLRDVVSAIAERSVRAYGSSFAAFRIYNAPELLKWAGL